LGNSSGDGKSAKVPGFDLLGWAVAFATFV
jgi:hypothetical protein